MEETEYKNNEKVLFKTKGKLSLPNEKSEEADCLVTEGHVVIEAKEPVNIPVTCIKRCDISHALPPISYSYPPRVQEPLSGTATLTFLNDLNKKHKLSLEMAVGDLYSFKQAIDNQMAGPAEVSTEISLEFASFWRRLWAAVIDGIILSVVGGFISRFSDFEGTAGVAWTVVAILVPVVYYVWPYSRGGQTIGKAILGIRVTAIDGSSLNWRKGFLRYLGYMPSAIALFIGYFWLIWDPNKQAWHDKIAGTCVLHTRVIPKEGRIREREWRALETGEARRRQRRWLLGLGIPALLVMLGMGTWFFTLIQGGLAEVKKMEPWPSPEVSPSIVVRVDLSHLGLYIGEIQDARNVEWTSQGLYSEGTVVTYKSNGRDTVIISALRYNDKEAASDDFASVVAWVRENAGTSTWTTVGTTGVIHGEWSDAYSKILWNDYWIVDILALEGTGFTPAVLVDKVRDAVASHWAAMAER